MGGTLTRDLVFVPLIQSEHEMGLLNDEAFHNIIDVLGRYKKGDLAYEDTVDLACALHAKGLTGQRHDDLKHHAAELFARREAELFRVFARTAFDLLCADHNLIVVTAEPQYVAEAVMEQLALDTTISSLYGVDDGVFTGAVQCSLAHRSQKAAALKSLAIDYAFGDSEGDIDMLAAAKHPVCIDPTPGLRKFARVYGWLISDGEHDKSIGIIQGKMGI